MKEKPLFMKFAGETFNLCGIFIEDATAYCNDWEPIYRPIRRIIIEIDNAASAKRLLDILIDNSLEAKPFELEMNGAEFSGEGFLRYKSADFRDHSILPEQKCFTVASGKAVFEFTSITNFKIAIDLVP